jgi:hypothetical protein
MWLMSSCVLACGERADANVVAESTLTAWVQGSNFPNGIGYSLVDPPLETFGAAAGSGNHSEFWTAASGPPGLPGNAVTGFSAAIASTQAMDPLGESHAASYANSVGLKFININAAAVTIDLVVQWSYQLSLTFQNTYFDSGDAGYYFRIRNVTTSTTLFEYDQIVALRSASGSLGAPLQLVLPAQSSTTIRVEGQAWADAYNYVPAPSAALAMAIGAMRLGPRRRAPRAR